MSNVPGPILAKIFMDVSNQLETVGVEHFKKEGGGEPDQAALFAIRKDILRKSENALHMLTALANVSFNNADYNAVADKLAQAGVQLKAMMALPAFENTILDVTINSAVARTREYAPEI